MLPIFNLLTIFYAFRSLQIARLVYQNWGLLRSNSFTPQEKQIADRASFFLSVPVAVFFHELAHALAIWAFGGEVIEFGYRFFWGFVTSDSVFTAGQEWFIALAGTLGSLAFGLVAWLIFRRNSSPTLHYFGLRTFRYQIFFSLIYYPIFTLLGFYGDWRTIYDFNDTRVLSGLTAAFHLVSLGLFVWAERHGWFEMAAFQTMQDQEKFSELEARASANPQDQKLQLQLVEAYRHSGMNNLARDHLNTYLKQNPNSAEGHLQLAALRTQGKQQVPGKARDSAKKALDLGLSEPTAVAHANQIIGQYNLGVGKLDEAIDYFSRGIAAVAQARQPGLTGQLNYFRAVAYRRKGQYQVAYQDIQQAINLSRDTGEGQAVSHYMSELETIERHAGKSLGKASAGNSPTHNDLSKS